MPFWDLEKPHQKQKSVYRHDSIKSSGEQKLITPIVYYNLRFSQKTE